MFSVGSLDIRKIACYICSVVGFIPLVIYYAAYKFVSGNEE